MKKSFFGLILLIFAVGSVLMFNSCSKDDQSSSATIDTTQKAIIKGKLFANFNLSNDTNALGNPLETLDPAPNGTKKIGRAHV